MNNISAQYSGNMSRNATLSSDNSDANQFLDYFRDAKFYSLAFILPIGLLCNTFAFSVFMCSPMRRTIPGIYFVALAVADNTVLFGELLLWLNSRNSHGQHLGINFMNTYNWLCQSVYFIRYAGRVWSSWLTISITVERFLTVAFPLKVARWSSTKKAKCVILLILVIAAGYSTYTFFTLEVFPVKDTTTLACQFRKRQEYEVLTWILLTVGELFLPSVIVALFTSLIIVKLAQARRRRHTMSRVDSGRTRPRSSEMSPTYTLLGVAIAFILIRLPYTVTYYVNEHKVLMFPQADAWSKRYIYAANSIAQTLAVLNYAMNFCLYCLCGSTFRAEMKRCVTCQKRRSAHGTSLHNSHGGGPSFKTLTTKLTPDLSDRANV